MENKSVRTAPVIVLMVMGIFYHTGVSLASPIRITGRVVEAREPVAGARVELYPAAPAYADALRQLAGDPPLPLQSMQTAADGTFELLAPEAGAWRVVVQAKDRLALEHRVAAADAVSLPPAELLRPSTVSIQALGPDGRPLAGLPLRVAPPMDGAAWERSGWQSAERRGVTGPDGRLVLPRSKLEPLNVYVTDPLYLGQVASEAHGDAVTVRPEPRPRTVEVLGAQGEPVAGALFRWGTWPVGVTGPDGRLSVSLPADGDLPLLVEGPAGERAQVEPGVEPVAGVLVVRLVSPEAANRMASAPESYASPLRPSMTARTCPASCDARASSASARCCSSSRNAASLMPPRLMATLRYAP